MIKKIKFHYLKQIHSVLPDNIKKLISNKQNTNLSDLKKSWSKILGNELADKCKLTKIVKQNDQNCIFLEVNRKNIIDIDYSRDQISDKINSFLGYKFVSKISINVEHNFLTEKKNKSLKHNQKVKNLIDSIQDEEIRKKLSKFDQLK